MPNLSGRRLDAWTAPAAEPAVQAAERAIVTESHAILADTLTISTTAESRRRLAHVLDLKNQAERNPRRRDAYQRAADDFRSWAAGVHLATLRVPHTQNRESTNRPSRRVRTPVVKHTNPVSEEGISFRRLVPRPPFPGQRRRHLFYTSTAPDGQVAARAEQETADAQPGLEDTEDTSRIDASLVLVAA